MPAKMTVVFVCDDCKKEKIVEENIKIEFYSDYLFRPSDLKGWQDNLTLFPWPYEGFPDGISLVCPDCAQKYKPTKENELPRVSGGKGER